MNTQEYRHAVDSGLRLTLREALREAKDWMRASPRAGLALLATTLMLGAGGAFAVVTPSERVEVRNIVQTVQPGVALEAQQDALSQHQFVLYRSTDSREQDTVATLLARLGVSDTSAESWLRSQDSVRSQILGHSQRLVQAEVTTDKRLQKLRVQWLEANNPYSYQQLEVRRLDNKSFESSWATGKVDVQTDASSAALSGDYFRSTNAAGLPTAVAEQVLNVLEPRVDIAAKVGNNDRLDVVYERLMVDGQPLGFGRVLHANAQLQGKSYGAVWFDAGNGKAGKYYTPDGQGVSPAYMSPMPGAVVTSGFTPFRLHPVFGSVRPHTGVDYRAAIGTSVQTIADGVVSFVGTQTGYGRVVIIQHADNQSSLYAHLNSFNVSVGQKVQQGQLIAKSGNSGWSTGPHLHFEIRDNDVPQDPEHVLAERRSVGLPASQRAQFDQVVAEVQRQVTLAQSVQTASAE